MTIAKALDLISTVNAALSAALPGVNGFSYIPDPAPDRYWRIDGFTITPQEAYKNAEQARHGLILHIIDAPPGGTKSVAWVAQTLMTAADALNGLKVDTRSHGLRPETANMTLEPRSDGVTDAHALVRFSAIIKE